MRDQGYFPWFDFPEIRTKANMTRWKKKIETAKKKEFYVPNEVNWTWIGQVGLEDSINPYLTKVFIQDRIQITCDGWRRQFQIQELVYRELCLELFSTVSFLGGEGMATITPTP